MELIVYFLMIEFEELNVLLVDFSLLIVDLCCMEQYYSVYIFGVVYLFFMYLMGGEFFVFGKLFLVEILVKVLGCIGLQLYSYVVVYDDEGGGWVGCLLWILDVIGYFGWFYFNGGLYVWV